MEAQDTLTPPADGRPKYERLKQHLLTQLAAGQFKAGQALPSENALARSLGIARNTVRQGLGELEREGLIRRHQGKGTFLNTERDRKIRQQLDLFALVLPEIHRSVYPSLVKGFDTEATSISHQMMICNTDHDVDKQGNFILQLIDKNVAGVAIVPTTTRPTPMHHIRQLHAHNIPVVFCHRKVDGAMAPHITWPWEKVGRMVGEALVQRGHRRIAYFGVYRYPVPEAYEKGLRTALEMHGIDLPEGRVHYAPSQQDQNNEKIRFDALKRMLAHADAPTAIFCSDDAEAEMIYLLATSLGIAVPQQLSIIGFGGTWRSGGIRERLASVVVNEQELGAQAAQILHEMRTGRRRLDSDEQILMPLSLLAAQTLGQAPSA